MDISADKYKSDGSRPGPFAAVLQTVMGFVRRLARLAILTDEERKKAGIYHGGEGRDG
jgi:hypothetical protein